MNKLPFPVSALAQHVLLLGKTRSGKSSKMRLIVEHFLDRDTPVCIIDPKGDWWGLKSSADGKKAGYSLIIFGSEWAKFADVRINKHSGAEIGQLVATGNRPCIIDMKGMTVSDRTQFFVAFADAYFRHAEGKRILAIDECHNFAPQGKVLDPQAGHALHWANRLASEGAGMGITLVSASQRPQKVHKDYATSHETLIACRAVHKLDRDASGDWVDACGDPAVKKDLLGSLAGMQRESAWVYSPEIGFGPKQITFPMFKTYDSFAPQQAKKSRRLKGWASIDLKEVEGKIAKVVEEAKANDPKELRRQITNLTAELRKAQAAKPVAHKANGKAAPVADPKVVTKLRTALEAAMKFIVEITAADFFKAGGEKIDKKKLEQVIADATNRGVKLIEDHLSQRGKQVERLQASSERLLKQLQAVLDGADKDVTVRVNVTHREPFAVTTSAKPMPRANPVAINGDGTLTGPEQRILNSLATWKNMGHPQVSNAQAAWLAIYSPKSSSYEKARGSLNANGFIAYAGDVMALTAEGEAHATPIDIGTSMADFVAAQLTGPERRIFDAVKGHPDGLSNDEAAAGANYSPASSSYEKARGSLNSKNLIDYAGGQLRPAPWLF